MATTPIVATGFIADDAASATSFPSAGRDSSTAAFQAIYWRCIAVFAFSSRLFNPDAAIRIFSNVEPPQVDGLALDRVFAGMGVETVRLDLTHRLPRDHARRWGNVFYVLDILRYCWDREPQASLALFDSDVVLTGPIDGLFDRLRSDAFAGYAVDYAADHNVNGLTPAEGERLALARCGRALEQPYRHYGGELFGANMAASARYRADIDGLWQEALARAGQPGGIVTEEHFWSVLFAASGIRIAQTDDLIKRMWTSPRYNNVVRGDERLPAWHLPAEKNHGFRDMFAWLADRSFDPSLDRAAFRAAAGRTFGIPRASATKRVRDMARRVRAKLKQ